MTTSISEVIRSRRTIKKFKPNAISVEEIKELLEVAIWAPNHKMREPWRFIAYVGEGKKRLVDIWKAEKEKGKFPRPMKPEKVAQLQAVPAFIIVVMPVDPRHHIFEEDLAAASACIQNFQLAAWERGIGVLWNTETTIYSPTFHEAIGVERGEKVLAILQVGYPDMTPHARERTPIDEKLTIISE